MRHTLSLAGLIMLLMLTAAGVGLFALDRSRADHVDATASLAALSEQRDAARQIEVAFKVEVQEWKNILLRGYDPTLLAQYRDAFATRQAEVATGLDRLAAEGSAEARRLATEHEGLGAAYDATLAAADLDTAEGVRAADAAVHGADRHLEGALEALSNTFGASLLTAAETVEARLAERYETTRQMLLYVALAGMLATFVLLVLLARRGR